MGEPNTKEPRLDNDSGHTEAGTESASKDGSKAGFSPGTVRKKHRMEGEKICRVCGDKAVAHNFDVITCESCKTFFRRNAHKKQKVCAFQGNCEVTVQTRRFCPACRLKKCFHIGMRADMILDEVGRQARMEKIMTNRKKREEAGKAGQQTKKSSDQSQCVPDSSGSETSPESARSPEAAVPESQAGARRSRTSSSVCCDSTDTSSSLSSRCCGSETPEPAKACNFQHVPTSLLPSDPMMYWHLMPEEHNLITELTVAYKDTLLRLPTSPEALATEFENVTLQETLGKCERFAAEVINFLKRVKDFRKLDLNDQQSVLKASAMMFMILKSSACFSEEKNAWIKEFGSIPVDAFARITQQEELINRYADFCRQLKRILKSDYPGYVLLSCIILFEPQAANVKNRQQVNVFKDKYSTLLKHHLESQYSYLFAAQYNEAIQDVVRIGKTLAVDMTAMFSSWKEFLAPLMREVINLN